MQYFFANKDAAMARWVMYANSYDLYALVTYVYTTLITEFFTGIV